MATSLTDHLPAEIQPQLVQHAAAWNLYLSMPLEMPMREQGESLLPLRAVKARVGMGKTKIYEQIKAGAFPACIKNGRTSLWIESEVQAWVQRQIKQQRSSPA
ncbi:MAG: helix-turn-helix transcriptional regulator [Achromobacter sp.]